jgi:hypothetical protein
MPVPVDPFDELLRPSPDETPEQRAMRLAREEQARQVSAAIDATIKAERNARRKKRIVRLLLLGQSESGGYFTIFLNYSLLTMGRQVNDTQTWVHLLADYFFLGLAEAVT